MTTYAALLRDYMTLKCRCIDGRGGPPARAHARRDQAGNPSPWNSNSVFNRRVDLCFGHSTKKGVKMRSCSRNGGCPRRCRPRQEAAEKCCYTE